MRIGIDIDDVIAKTGQIFYQKINERFGTEAHFTNVPYYSWIDEQVFKKGIKPEEFYGFINEFQTSAVYHDNLPLRRGFKKIVKDLYGAGHIIYLISNRHVLILPYTTVWLKKLGILKYVSGVLHNSYTDKNHEQFKIREAKRLKIDIFLEDALDYAVPLAKKNIQVILFDRPWNQKKGLAKNIYRVDDWRQAEQIILRLAKKVI